MTLSHGADFSINLVDAFVAEYKTIGNVTTLIIVSDNQSLEQIATINGQFKVESAIVVNSGQEINNKIVELKGVELEMAGPNPFNPSTSLNVVVPDAGHVTVSVYDMAGRLVDEIANSWHDAGDQSVVWNASGYPSGIYFVKLEAGSFVASQKIVLVK